MFYLKSKIKKEREKAVYHKYVADSLYCLQVGDRQMNNAYSDIVDNKIDTRSGEEIAADIIKRAGLKVVNK